MKTVKRKVLASKDSKMSLKELNALRTAIADYMESEGCSCCRDCDAHDKHAEVLAKLLKIPRYAFHRFSSSAKMEAKKRR